MISSDRCIVTDVHMISLSFSRFYREEYVLLNPDFVLPEFLMHVHFTSDNLESSGLRSHSDPPPRSPSNASSRRNSLNKISVPSLLTMADGYHDSAYGKGYLGDEVGRPINTDAEKSSEFSGYDSFGKLLMSNKIAQHERGNATNNVMNHSEGGVTSKVSHTHHQSESDDGRQRHPLLSTSMIQRKQQIVNYVRSVPENFNIDRKAALRSAISSIEK